MRNPPWLDAALLDNGLTEIPGVRHAPRIQKMLVRVSAWWNDDETPWCGIAMGDWMLSAKVSIPKNPWRAMSWATWGHQLSGPEYGCVVVFTRKGGGHVGLIVGKDQMGNLLVYGANQDNAVNVRSFPVGRVATGGYRWPIEYPLPPVAPLPRGSAHLSLTEA